MDRKVLFGLLAIGTAALSLRGRRRRTAFNGLSSVPDKHHRAYRTYVERAEQNLAKAEVHVANALAARKGRAYDTRGQSASFPDPYWRDYVTHKQCGEAGIRFVQAAIDTGRAQSEYDGSEGIIVDRQANRVMEMLTETYRDYRKACHIAPKEPAARGPAREFPGDLDGLGSDPDVHGVNRSTLATAAGFRIRDARRAARNGWCESAFKLLREAEYHAGQVTAHAKSIPGKAGEAQRRKAQALRVGVNALARDLKQSCTIHRRRTPAGPRNQGTLPF